MHTAVKSQGIEINSVLRNTYMLLSMSLIFAAFTAFLSRGVAFSAPLFLGTFVLSIVLLFATMAMRNSPWGIALIFAFTGLQGFSIGPLLQKYLNTPGGGMLVLTAAAMTAAVFIALSLYVLVTRKDFSFLGGMLFIGLIALVVASLISMFFPIPGVQLVLSVVGVLIFSGYVLYDTSRIVHGGETNYIIATMGLFLDILNLFLNFLNIGSLLGGDD